MSPDRNLRIGRRPIIVPSKYAVAVGIGQSIVAVARAERTIRQAEVVGLDGVRLRSLVSY